MNFFWGDRASSPLRLFVRNPNTMDVMPNDYFAAMIKEIMTRDLERFINCFLFWELAFFCAHHQWQHTRIVLP